MDYAPIGLVMGQQLGLSLIFTNTFKRIWKNPQETFGFNNASEILCLYLYDATRMQEIVQTIYTVFREKLDIIYSGKSFFITYFIP